MLKKSNSKLLKMATTMMLVAGFILAMSIVTASAATTPTFTSATYNVGTGQFAFTGTNLADVTGTANDIDFKKMTITNGKNFSYTLTSPKAEKTTTGAAVTLSAKDAAALAEILDKDGTKAMNGGTYQITVLAGWNGTTSTNDFAKHALTVSGVPTLTSAAYNYGTGELTLTGTNLVSITGTTPNDITPKYITITDSASKMLTISSATKAVDTDGTTAKIVLSAKDKLALEAIFDQDGTKSVANNAYTLTAAYGWNGKNTLAVAAPVAITVTGYVAPSVSLKADTTVTYKQSIPSTAELKANKVGTIYIVTQGAIDASSAQSDLDAYVTTGAAIKVNATSPQAIVTASTSTLKMTTTSSAVYFAVLVDKAGTLSDASTQKIIINNVLAPSLSATAAKGAAVGTVKVTATTEAAMTLAYEISNSAIATPPLYTDTTKDSSIKAYTSGTDITGVDATTNKYLAIYEIDSKGLVVKFKAFVLSASYIKTAVAPPALHADTTTATTASAIDITFTDSSAWRTAITAVKDGTTTLTLTTDYAITAGKITFVAGKLNAGSHTITVVATGYTDATVTQTVTAP